MIKEIVIKNVATYDDKGVTIDNIEKINYIYGANGCGKTTISNLLGNFELEKYSDCQVKWANNVAERVFVYNKTFREKNFKESDIAGIFTLGQATTEEIQEINKKKADLEDLKRNIIANKNTIESLNSSHTQYILSQNLGILQASLFFVLYHCLNPIYGRMYIKPMKINLRQLLLAL